MIASPGEQTGIPAVDAPRDEGGKKPLMWEFDIARIWRADGLPVVLGKGSAGWGAYGCISEEGENVRVPMTIQWVEVADAGGGRDVEREDPRMA